MSNNVIHMGNLDMLRSMYEFKATYAKTLSFKANEYFILHQTITKHKNWWEVINERGDMGFIPSNYVEKVTVSPAFYLQYLESCMDSVRVTETSLENVTSARRDLILRLKELKRQIETLPEVCQNSVGLDETTVLPPLLFRNSDGHLETIKTSQSSTTSFSSQITEIKNGANDYREEPRIIHKAKRGSMSTCDMTKINNTEDTNDSNKNGHDVDRIRSEPAMHSKPSPVITSQAVYELAESVRINTKLSHHLSKIAVQTVVQGLHDLLPASAFPYLSTILTHCQTSLVADDVQIDQTHDASRLRIIFKELTSCKEDSQQRSWMLHEDESVIKEYIMELISILSNADSSISRHVVSMEQYHVITTLIQYYQMEVRWSIRQLLLQAFGVLCSLDKMVLSIMLNSILPGELARDMMSNPRNIPKLNYSSLLLTMILSMGEQMPVTHLEDPVRIFDHEPAPPHSLLKLFLDLFGRSTTADLFYTNDIKVLIDIVVRNIADLSPGDRKRQQYLELCRRIMKNANYGEHYHRRDEILKCFTRIFCEEAAQSIPDQKLVRDIMNEFPLYFK